MKKLFLAASLLFAYAFGPVKAQADGLWTSVFGRPSERLVFRSTDVPANTNGRNTITGLGGITLWKVIVSSPAAVDLASQAVLKLYDSTGPATGLKFEVQTATNQVVGPSEKTIPIKFAQGMTFSLSTGAISGDMAGKVTLVYSPGQQQDFQVWSSSFMTVTTATNTIAKGPVLLHKIYVLRSQVGGGLLRVHDQYSLSPNRQKIELDLGTDTENDGYEFNMFMSSGLTINATSAGSTAAQILVLYKTNPSGDYEMWSSTYTSGTVAARAVFTGRGTLGKIFNGTASANSHLNIYNAQGSASGLVTGMEGDTIKMTNYGVHLSSGLTVESLTGGTYTILYRKK